MGPDIQHPLKEASDAVLRCRGVNSYEVNFKQWGIGDGREAGKYIPLLSFSHGVMFSLYSPNGKIHGPSGCTCRMTCSVSPGVLYFSCHQGCASLFLVWRVLFLFPHCHIFVTARWSASTLLLVLGSAVYWLWALIWSIVVSMVFICCCINLWSIFCRDTVIWSEWMIILMS